MGRACSIRGRTRENSICNFSGKSERVDTTLETYVCRRLVTVDRNHSAENSGQWWALTKTVMNVLVP
jgi:hypothetical protein